MRITRRVFHDLAIWQIGFGLCIGVVFPPFVMLLGVSGQEALTPAFFAACLFAGALAGISNYVISHRVVGVRLRVMAERMTHVERSLGQMTVSNDLSACTPEACAIVVDSEDEIGESALAFNRLVEALSTSMRIQLAVRSFSEMLTSELEIESLAEKALRRFALDAGAAGGLIAYEAGGELKVAAAHGLRDPAAVVGSSHVGAAVRSGERQLVTIPEGVSLESVVADFRPKELRVDPLAHKGVPLGVVVLANTRQFTTDQNALVDLFLPSLSLALNNAIAHDRVHRLAALDALTGIYNRRFGLGRLSEEFGRAVRVASPLGVLLFDIDGFKAVNDTYGHLVGDRVLKSVAGIARSCLREGDVLLRYGGEELLAVLPAASTQDLFEIGERVRRAVEHSSIMDGPRTVRVTLSVGGASYPDQNVERDVDLIRLADQALYHAKKGGRNKLQMAA